MTTIFKTTTETPSHTFGQTDATTRSSSITTPLRNSSRLRALSIGCCLTIAAALSACGKNDDNTTAGQKLDAAVAKTAQAAAEAKTKAEASMAKAGEALKDATQKAEVASGKSASKIGNSVDDMAITASVSAALAKESDLSAIKINVDTTAGVVTLNGPAPTASAREKATSIAKQVKGVTSVNNKLVLVAG